MVKAVRVTVVALCVISCWSALVNAQDTTATVTTIAPIYLQPDTARTPLRTAAVGTTLRVVEDNGDWLRVEFQDPQFGRRTGYVQTKNVRVTSASQQPMDLSIKPTPPPARRPAEGELPEEAPRQVSTSQGPRFARGWIDVNFGIAIAAEDTVTTTLNVPVAGENNTFTAEHHWPSGGAFNFGGGFMFTPQFGLGVSFAGTAHKDTVDLSIRIPHPTLFNRFASDAEPTEGDFQRIESSVNIQAVAAADLTDRVRVRLWGGPTLFRLQQDAVSDIHFNQVFNLLGTNVVEITTYDTQKIEFADAIGWGFHVGGDVSWFFSRVVGVGGFANFSRGTVTTFEPLTEQDADFKMGGFQAGGGLRLRF